MDTFFLYWSYFNFLDFYNIIPYPIILSDNSQPEPPITGIETLYLGRNPEDFEYKEYKD
jgi:hypothetical protein